METSGIVPTMPIGGDGFGAAGSGIWLFAILALFLFGGGAYGNRFGGNVATVEDLNTTSNFARLENQVRSNAELTERKTDTINSGICSLGYEMATKFAETNANITAQVQSVKDLIQTNKIEELQSQISQLQLAQAMCGVVRYPTSITYNGGFSPFCSCGCQTNI